MNITKRFATTGGTFLLVGVGLTLMIEGLKLIAMETAAPHNGPIAQPPAEMWWVMPFANLVAFVLVSAGVIWLVFSFLIWAYDKLFGEWHAKRLRMKVDRMVAKMESEQVR